MYISSITSSASLVRPGKKMPPFQILPLGRNAHFHLTPPRPYLPLVNKSPDFHVTPGKNTPLPPTSVFTPGKSWSSANLTEPSGTCVQGCSSSNLSKGIIVQGCSCSNLSKGIIDQGCSCCNLSKGVIVQGCSCCNLSKGVIVQGCSYTNLSKESLFRGVTVTFSIGIFVLKHQKPHSQHGLRLFTARRPDPWLLREKYRQRCTK